MLIKCKWTSFSDVETVSICVISSRALTDWTRSDYMQCMACSFGENVFGTHQYRSCHVNMRRICFACRASKLPSKGCFSLEKFKVGSPAFCCCCAKVILQAWTRHVRLNNRMKFIAWICHKQVRMSSSLFKYTWQAACGCGYYCVGWILGPEGEAPCQAKIYALSLPDSLVAGFSIILDWHIENTLEFMHKTAVAQGWKNWAAKP